nr:hypothetical protein [Frankia gtarii]
MREGDGGAVGFDLVDEAGAGGLGGGAVGVVNGFPAGVEEFDGGVGDVAEQQGATLAAGDDVDRRAGGVAGGVASVDAGGVASVDAGGEGAVGVEQLDLSGDRRELRCGAPVGLRPVDEVVPVGGVAAVGGVREDRPVLERGPAGVVAVQVGEQPRR